MGHEDAILNERPIGVIIPPPETKKIIDKAAELVAKYGSNVEATLKNDEKNLPKFSFLNINDPYRPYYDQRINELIKGNKNLNIKETKFLGRKTDSNSNIINVSNLNNTSVRNSSIQNELRKIIEEKQIEKAQLNDLKPPPQDQYSISHPNISSIEMDIIKATAQFVARNGQRFLSGLSEREMKNPQYDFLKPQHNLFGYFTYLVESYAKCFRKEDINKLNLYANDEQALIKKATERYLWEKKSKETQKKKDLLDENEKNQMAQIDWYDFAVVEVIDFNEEELFNTVPITNQININENINSVEANINNLMKIQNMQNNLEDNSHSKFVNARLNNVNLTPSISKSEDKKIEKITKIDIEESTSLPEPGMKIVKNYSRKQVNVESNKKDTIKCPLCKEWVNIDDWPMHIKIELLDPKWKEIQQEIQERKMEVNLAPTGDFLSYLSDFSKYRPDLFGEIKDVVKIEEKKKVEAKSLSAIWDGYAPNMTRTTANIAMLAQQTRKNIEETRKLETGSGSINQGYQQVNTAYTEMNNYSTLRSNLNSNVNVSISSTGKFPNINAIPISVTQQTPQISSSNSNQSNLENKNESYNKQSNINKTNISSNLIPEELFLKKIKNPFKLNVKIPESNLHSNLRGQIITITVNPSDKILTIKSEILKTLTINLSRENFILKSFTNLILDENYSAAYYNLTNGTVIELEIA